MGSADIDWVVLTMGDRPTELTGAIASILSAPGGEHDADGVGVTGVGVTGVGVTVVANGVRLVPPAGCRLVELEANAGVPGGRDEGVARTDAAVVGFLDDDALLGAGASERILEEFSSDPRLGAVTLRLVDEDGETSRRHIPRPGAHSHDRGGDVAYFLGGACAIRRVAYEQVGGYFTDLFYGHEEIELSWRLVDAGWSIRYLADVEVFHPRTEISRHPDGWALTGRNRVWIARRTLPWPVALVHMAFWLLVGVVRAPRGACRARYLEGWRSGWSGPLRRRPISWRGVWRLTRLGRPPVI